MIRNDDVLFQRLLNKWRVEGEMGETVPAVEKRMLKRQNFPNEGACTLFQFPGSF